MITRFWGWNAEEDQRNLNIQAKGEYEQRDWTFGMYNPSQKIILWEASLMVWEVKPNISRDVPRRSYEITKSFKAGTVTFVFE